MENTTTIEGGDFVVPLFEKEKRVLKVLSAKHSIVAETEHGVEIAAPCNYRLATEEEIKEFIVWK